jgi:benzil reductase ((S)-benzoin forming)
MNKLAIITGTSRGLGLNLAEQLLQNGYTVIGIARTNSIKHPDFHFLKMDLSEGKNLLSKLQQFLKRKKISLKNERVVLINNAATVLPVNYFHKVKLDEIRQSCILNLQVPVFLSHFVINVFLPKTKFLTICNISSGAAVHALENWSMYCTMKSGLKMFTDCLNVDYSEVGQLKAFSFYPGVMDTQMQATIRQQPPKNFKNLNRFKELKEKNELLDPLFVSQSIVGLVSQPQSIKKSEYDIKNFKRS